MSVVFAADIGALIGAGRYLEAEHALRAALANAPHDPDLLDALGVCLYWQERLDEALAAYARALAGDVTRATTWFNLGTALSHAGRPLQAATAYRRSLLLDPTNESVKYNLSRALLLLGQWQEGWQLYEARGRKPNPSYQALACESWRGEPPGSYALLLSTEQGLGGGVHDHGRGAPPVTLCRLTAVRCPDPTAGAAGKTSLAPIGMAECRYRLCDPPSARRRRAPKVGSDVAD